MAWNSFRRLHTQFVFPHENLTLIPALARMVDGKKLVCRLRYGFTCMRLERRLEPNVGAGTGNVDAIVFRLIQGIGQAEKGLAEPVH